MPTSNFGFEDQFRGSQDAIRSRLESYLPFFAGTAYVVDVGCGRGEFLDLLKARGIAARGIDLNPEMVEIGRSRGLDATHADAVGFLSAQEDGRWEGCLRHRWWSISNRPTSCGSWSSVTTSCARAARSRSRR